jgi:hypothetical protein
MQRAAGPQQAAGPCPYLLSRMLAGLRSMCMMGSGLECRNARAAATSAATRTRSGQASGGRGGAWSGGSGSGWSCGGRGGGGAERVVRAVEALGGDAPGWQHASTIPASDA